MQDRASPEFEPGGYGEFRARGEVVLKASHSRHWVAGREQQRVQMKLERVDRHETIGRAGKGLSAATCWKQGVSRLPVLLRQAQYLAGRRYRARMEKLAPLDRHEGCLNTFDKYFANARLSTRCCHWPNVRFSPLVDRPMSASDPRARIGEHGLATKRRFQVRSRAPELQAPGVRMGLEELGESGELEVRGRSRR